MTTDKLPRCVLCESEAYKRMAGSVECGSPSPAVCRLYGTIFPVDQWITLMGGWLPIRELKAEDGARYELYAFVPSGHVKASGPELIEFHLMAQWDSEDGWLCECGCDEKSHYAQFASYYKPASQPPETG